ncbi:MAG: hypothetical protein BroJett005_06390 [Ignavibacteriota bacterium]|nr:MAG: hypothetical protein BroJett005_06390 [Ignavibacteriota bacterium]
MIGSIDTTRKISKSLETPNSLAYIISLRKPIILLIEFKNINKRDAPARDTKNDLDNFI